MTKTSGNPVRPLAALLAVYTLVLTSGAPLPMGMAVSWLSVTPAVEEGAQRFPCESCACGCNTAERCWSKCCCHTPAQRLAWARREGVRPPESALDAAEAIGLDTSTWRPDGPRCFRVRPPVDESVAEPDWDELPPCCRAARLRALKQAETAQPESPSPETQRPATRGVALLQAAACQGLVEAWLSLGEAPLPSPVEPAGEAPARYARFLKALAADSHNEGPTPPPPRRA